MWSEVLLSPQSGAAWSEAASLAAEAASLAAEAARSLQTSAGNAVLFPQMRKHPIQS